MFLHISGAFLIVPRFESSGTKMDSRGAGESFRMTNESYKCVPSTVRWPENEMGMDEYQWIRWIAGAPYPTTQTFLLHLLVVGQFAEVSQLQLRRTSFRLYLPVRKSLTQR